MKDMYNKYLNNEIKLDKLTIMGVLALVVVISGIFGWVYEFIFYFFNSGMKTFYYRGANFLPWINIYAYGALFIILLNRNNKKKPLKIFILSVLITGVLEFISGYVMYNYFDGLRCWDYNTEILNFGNIGGYICFRSVFFFGISSLLLMYVILPICVYIATHLNRKTFLILSFSLFTIFIFDEVYNLIIARVLNTPRARDVYSKIGYKYMNYR